MVVEKAASLPRPIKWFSIPRCYRAEQPQKGRLREFGQWNIDIVGDDSERADRECLAVCIDALLEFGLTTDAFKIGWNHREILTKALTNTFIPADAYYILDKLQKLDKAGRNALYQQRQCSEKEKENFELIAHAIEHNAGDDIIKNWPAEAQNQIKEFQQRLDAAGLGGMCKFDIGIVRGLAYYTGFVFEVTDAKGENRAIAGGGRYDKLIETFSGPCLPAIGFGMGDVVLEIVLRENGKLPEKLTPTPDVFIINALDETKHLDQLLKDFRRSIFDSAGKTIIRPGLFAQTSNKATKNIGKLLQEAAASGARFAVILAPEEISRNMVKLKDMRDRSEEDVPFTEIVDKAYKLLKSN